MISSNIGGVTKNALDKVMEERGLMSNKLDGKVPASLVVNIADAFDYLSERTQNNEQAMDLLEMVVLHPDSVDLLTFGLSTNGLQENV